MSDLIDSSGKMSGEKWHDKEKELKASYVMVYNSFGELYIVEIASSDKKFYQKYGLSAASVVNNGESPEDAAKRALKVELGIVDEPKVIGNELFDVNGVKKIGYFFVIEYNGKIILNQDNIVKGEFVAKEMVENMLTLDPDIYTPSFLVFWNKYKDILQREI